MENISPISELEEEGFIQFLEAMPDAIIFINAEGSIVFINAQAEQLFGYTRSNLVGQKLEMLIPESYRSGHPEHRINYFTSQKIRPMGESGMDLLVQRKNGEIFPVEINLSSLKTKSSIITLATIRDMTKRHKIEAQLKDSVLEKEAMLKEIYHRVKNNLQVVSSLLNLQADSIQDIQARKIFVESATRVKAMSLVHGMLYRSTNLTQIEMTNYVNTLSKHLKEIYHAESSNVGLSINTDDILLTITEAIPCGLIINELISNAFKHAFTLGKHGELRVTMTKKQNKVVLIVQDNGCGVPPNFDFKNTKTLGMQLMQNLTNQLSGTLELDSRKGTTITLTFPYKD